MSRDKSAGQAPLICNRCAQMLRPGEGNFYVIKVEAFADPTPPDLSDEYLSADLEKEIKDLIEEAERFSEQEMMDQVYRRLTFYLCGPCYRKWIENPTGAEPGAGATGGEIS